MGQFMLLLHLGLMGSICADTGVFRRKIRMRRQKENNNKATHTDTNTHTPKQTKNDWNLPLSNLPLEIQKIYERGATGSGD